MFSRPLAFFLVVLGCLTAAAGGAYLATRHNAAERATTAVAAEPTATVPSSTGTASAMPSTQPVAETEAAVSSPAPASVTAKPAKAEAELTSAAVPIPRRPEAAAPKPVAPAPRQAPAPARTEPVAARTAPVNGAGATGQPQPEPQAIPFPAVPPPPATEPAKPVEPQPEPPRVPQFEEVILPSSSVIGLQLETSLSSERARLEDRVDARVSRDVMAAGRVAIPAGSRMIGSVIEIDKGGKVKTPAHIGIRFHTLVLADGTQVALRTEPIFRNAESPAGSSAKKIGGATVAGAILGGILGGGKGAAIGAAAGAGGGSAAVMAGDRAAVNLPAGSFVNATLSSPATITVERRE
jgi:hypothetical protein